MAKECTRIEYVKSFPRVSESRPCYAERYSRLKDRFKMKNPRKSDRKKNSKIIHFCLCVLIRFAFILLRRPMKLGYGILAASKGVREEKVER